MVDAKGNIEIPKIGTVHVEKMTIIQLKDTIEEKFAEWIKNPVVDIKILNREITVLGEVRDPQVIPVDKEKNTLMEMISRCKGFETYANIKSIKVMRQVGEDVHVANIDLTENGDYLKKNINLYPGDVVVIPSKKNKEFDRRVSIIIPFATAITAAAILFNTF
jgi:polysaccharide biosynthesis/export protein